jgi:predicted amidohydrolase YtcJ
MRKLISIFALILSTSIVSNTSHGSDELTVYTAKKIITMEPSLPEANAVAVKDGRIVAVGTLETLQPWTSQYTTRFDSRFEQNILMPGFIDPHVHPSLPAVLTQIPFIAPDDRSLPTGEFPGAITHESYISRLKSLVSDHYSKPEGKSGIPFVTWGFHQLWHGDVYRQELDQLFPEEPVILWHRSFHELVLNTAALELLEIKEPDVKDSHEVDWEKGHFWELGARFVLTKKPMLFMFSAARYGEGMENFVEMLHKGGVTSAMDMGIGVYGNAEIEIALIQRAMRSESAATRIVLTPIVTYFLGKGVSPQSAHDTIAGWAEGNTDKVIFDKHFKLMLDGAIFSGLAQFDFPGYIDGHKGVWLAPLEETYRWSEFFWEEGYQLHFHTNGDKSTDALLDIVRRLQEKRPRTDHRAVLEHFAYATEDQMLNLSALGVSISANSYYQYILSDIYAEQWLGEDRARAMVPLGSAKRAGMRVALHSDSPMAPLSPLTLAWAAVNRNTINGNENARQQKLSVHDALKAITIDAAWMMRWEDQVGSIRAGKRADFVVLEKNPYKVKPETLKDIRVLGTVFEGKHFPVK